VWRIEKGLAGIFVFVSIFWAGLKADLRAFGRTDPAELAERFPERPADRNH
jgi:hypothetical protein